MKKKRRIVLCFISSAILVLITGCSSLHYTSKNKLIILYEDAGYDITNSDHVGEIDGLDRVQAQKGVSYIDVCYDVKESECSDVCDLLSKLHPGSSLTGYNAGKGIVYCFSDQDSFTISQFKLNIDVSVDVPEIDVPPVIID